MVRCLLWEMLNDLDQEAAKQIVHFFVCFFFLGAAIFVSYILSSSDVSLFPTGD